MTGYQNRCGELTTSPEQFLSRYLSDTHLSVLVPNIAFSIRMYRWLHQRLAARRTQFEQRLPVGVLPLLGLGSPYSIPPVRVWGALSAAGQRLGQEVPSYLRS